MTSAAPLVTLGIIAYNAAPSVGRALESALAQDWGEIEIVAVDDASTDGTTDLLRAAAASDPRIRAVVRAENGGVALSRNAVIEHARGEFIAFFDDDDVSLPHRVRAQVERLLAYEAAFAEGAPVACHAARRQVYPDGTSRIERTMGEEADGPAPAGLAAARRVLAGTPLAGAYGSCASCSQLARTETFRALGGFDPAFRRAEDTEFFIRLARAGGHFPGIAEPLVVQTMTLGSDKGLAREREYLLALIDKHRDLFADEAEYRYCRDWAELKHAWLGGRRAAFIRQLVNLGLRHPLQTLRRLALAHRNLGGNRALSRLHLKGVPH
jgi:glycosyltransferase involved in cell wall biosynthesis